MLGIGLGYHTLPSQRQDARHSLKVNLFSPWVKTISVQYEYSFSAKKSVLCQAGYSMPNYLLEKYYDQYKSFGSRKIIFKDFRFNGGMQISPEYRYYFKAKQNSGFFMGTYLRYAHYTIQSHVNYSGETFNIAFTFKGTYSSANIGIISGYKWLVGEHFIIESWLLCLHGGTNRFLLNAKDELELVDKPTFLLDLENALTDFQWVRKWASNITDRNINIGFGYSFVGTRAGLCLGYRF